jgi:hypothetical protein
MRGNVVVLKNTIMYWKMKMKRMEQTKHGRGMNQNMEGGYGNGGEVISIDTTYI